MKKTAILSFLFAITLAACNPSNNRPGESGAVNDGTGPADQNGALQDTGYKYTPQTDTSKAENRTDVQPRQ